jgi:squalene-hopene/tetraprenyl-beta-curcumene cyclase
MLKKILIGLAAAVLLLLAAGAYVYVFEQTSHSEPFEAAKPIPKTDDKIADSIRRAAEYLRVRQESDGHFSKGLADPKPAFTALVVDSLARSPDRYNERDHPWIAKAVKGILDYQKENGCICSAAFPLETHVTSVSVMALTALENPAHKDAIDRAVKFLRSTQNTDAESSKFGGAGYSKDGNPSGEVTALWVEALKNAGVKEGDPAFENAKKFMSRLQNDSETNKETPPKGVEIGKDGGLTYRPFESNKKLKSDVNPETGNKIPKSYGLMTYAGLKTFLYMAITKEDPRVKSAYRWVRDNYTLDENRNMGAHGLFYYYLTLAKALEAYGESIIETTDGKKHNWAQELSDRIISLQEADGSWKNKASAEWMEGDAVLVTAYTIRTLTICHNELARQKKEQSEGPKVDEAAAKQ